MIEELTRIYLNEYRQEEEKLSEEEQRKYFDYVLSKNCIHTYGTHDNLLGFIESWRLDFQQFGRLICYAPFNIYEENITEGPICYLANIWIHPEHRRGAVIRQFKYDFFRCNMDAEYFVGEAFRKKTQPIKVFKKQEAYKKWARREVI